MEKTRRAERITESCSQIFRERREKLLAKIEQDMVCVLIAGGRAKRSHSDVYFKHRPSSHFLYLTGIDREHCMLLLSKSGNKTVHILIYQQQSELEKIWEGGAEEVSDLVDYGYDEVLSIEQAKTMTTGYFSGISQTHHLLISQSDTQDLNEWMNTKPWSAMMIDDTKLDQQLAAMRIIKDEQEIQWMRASAEKASNAFNHTIKNSLKNPYNNEASVFAEYCYTLNRQGLMSQPYPPIIASGKNACALHYRNNNAPINKGECILMDAGTEVHYYASDITRTWPNDGQFTKQQRQVYEAVLDCQKKIIASLRPGVSYMTLQLQSKQLLIEHLVDIGVLTGNISQLLKNKASDAFYMHGLGHSLGLDVHDVMPVSREEWILEAGMVITIEPGLYFTIDNEHVPKSFQGIGVRIEDDCLITANGCDVLTKEAWKEIDQISH